MKFRMIQTGKRFFSSVLRPAATNSFVRRSEINYGIRDLDVSKSGKYVWNFEPKRYVSFGADEDVLELDIDPNSPTKTMTQVKLLLAKMMGTPKGYKVLPPSRSHLLPLLPESQQQLPVRNMKDSYDTATILLSKSPMLQDRYSTVLGTVRIGRLLEDLDLFAVWLSLKHIHNPKSESSPVTPYSIVTAGVDYINFSEDRPKALDDLRLTGCVVNTGKTSMEISVTIETFTNGEWRQYIKAFFAMVARNSTNSGGAFVNKLVPDGPAEISKHKESELRKKRRHLEQKASLLKIPPTVDEQRLIYDKFIKTIDLKDPTLHKRILPPNAVWMDATTVSNSIYPQPDNRNHHNTVFGGFIMRQASELAWIIAFEHGRNRPFLCHISDFSFKSPVSINAFLKMSGQMVYTELNYAQVVINCEMFHGLTREKVTTNEFHYTFRYNEEAPEVMPLSYLDTLLWVDGRRHFLEAMENLERNETDLMIDPQG